MNIYITPSNEQRLRAYSGSMSGLVNKLLSDHFSRKGGGVAEEPLPSRSPVPDRPKIEHGVVEVEDLGDLFAPKCPSGHFLVDDKFCNKKGCPYSV